MKIIIHLLDSTYIGEQLFNISSLIRVKPLHSHYHFTIVRQIIIASIKYRKNLTNIHYNID